jgi:isoquinoline 1-oxidoreductase alpha subunit
MASVALLNKNSQPTVDQIVRHMDGNVCRCGVYVRIIKAIQMAATDKRDRKEAE